MILLDLLLVEEVGPVADGEEEEGGGEADPGQDIYFLGSKLVILKPGRESWWWRSAGQDGDKRHTLRSFHSP